MRRALFNFELHQVIMTAVFILVCLAFLVLFVPKPPNMAEKFMEFARKADLSVENGYTELFDFTVDSNYAIKFFYVDESCFNKINNNIDEWRNKLVQKYVSEFSIHPYTYMLCSYKAPTPNYGVDFINKDMDEIKSAFAVECNNFFENPKSSYVEENSLVCYIMKNNYPIMFGENKFLSSIVGPVSFRYLEFAHRSGDPYIKFLIISQ